MRIFGSWVTAFLISFCLFQSASAADLIVSEFVPQGEVKNIRQIQVRFSDPIVRMGNPRMVAPIEGDCLKGGDGRWIDSSTWVYDFQETLPSGIKCQFKLKSTVQSLNGRFVKGTRLFSFATGQAQIDAVAPNTYGNIEDDQYFAFLFDGEIKKEEVAKLFRFSIEGLGDSYTASVVDEKSAVEIFKHIKTQWQPVMEFDEDYSRAINRRGDYNKIKSSYLVLKLDRRLPLGKILSVQFTGKIPQQFSFRVREDFKATFNCERENASAPCTPLSTISVQFNENVEMSLLKEIYLKDINGLKILPKFSGNLNRPDMAVKFPPPFLESAEYQVILPKGLKGESGRFLSNVDSFPLAFRTSVFPPLLKFPTSFGIIEAGPEAAIPVTLRELEPEVRSIVQLLSPHFSGQQARLEKKNIVQIFEFIREASRSNSNRSIFSENPPSLDDSQNKKNRRYSQSVAPQRQIAIPKPNGAQAFEVVGIPVKQPGFYVVEMVSPKLGQAINPKGVPFYVQTTALVTDLGVNMKYTKNEVLVWVTELKTAKSVTDARIDLFDCNGNPFAQGRTGTDGTALIKTSTETSKNCNYESLLYDGFFAVASKGKDFSFTASNWNRGIEPFRFQVKTYGGNRSLHSVIARNLLRPGEVLHMKHFIRNQSISGLEKPDTSRLPSEIILRHTTQDSEYKVPVKWDSKTTSGETIWTIPKGMKLGNWTVKLGKKDADTSGSFRVENFRVPLMKGQIQTPAKEIVQPKTIPIQLGLEFLGGGPAAGFQTKLKWNISNDGRVDWGGSYNDFNILNGGLKEGVVREGDESENEIAVANKNVSGAKEIKLDSQGAASLEISGIKPAPGLQTVSVEMNFKDPSGEYQSIGRSFTIYPSERIVGIRAKSWSTTADKVGFEALVTDTKMKPISNAEVEMELYSSESISHRKRILGGFYSYEDFRETKKIRSLCKGNTNAKGLLFCETKVTFVGQIYAVAKATDPSGRSSFAHTFQWVNEGNESPWISSNDGDRVDLIPSKKNFEPGEMAQFEFHSPFKSGRILLTIEREGMIDHQIIDIQKGGTQILKVPVKDTWAPNVFVSAVAVRGRVEGYKPTALVDLGRPSFKMGLTEINVGWKKHELKVQLNLDKTIYPVRATAKASIKVTDFNNKPVQGEIILAAVDEGLLELHGNSTWNLLEAMMSPRALKVNTATSYTEIVGRRHYGIKAVASGGDGSLAGGASKARELFDTLLTWKGKVTLNKNGQANVEIPINDALTSFRVFVAAYSGSGQFGSTYKSFQTTQDFMIFAGLPVVVRKGDQFVAEYTVRNTSNMEQNVTASLDSNLMDKDQKQIHPDKNFVLKPQASERLEWSLRIPEETSSVQATMSIKDSKGHILDKIKKSIEVSEVNPIRVQQMNLENIDTDKKSIYLDKVSGSLTNTTSAEITLSPSLIGGSSSGQENFWKFYRFNCLEQKTSRAVALGKRSEWEKISTHLEAYIDNNGLLKYFPDSEEGSEVLTAYVLSIVYDAGWDISDTHLDRFAKGLDKFLEGKIHHSGMTFADDEYRRLLMIEALSKHRRLNVAHLNSIQAKPQIWPTSQLVTWYQILLMEKNVKQRDLLLKEAESILKSRIYMSGAKASLRDYDSNFFWWLMIDPNTTLAKFFIAAMNRPSWKADMPKLMRGFLEMQRQGSWYSTTANAWGVLALKSYVNAYEKVAVTGETKFALGPITKSLKWTEKNLTLDFLSIEKKGTLAIEHVGTGKPWAFVSIKAAVPLQNPVVSGFKVEKTIEAVEQKLKSSWSRGDVARVRLKVTSMTDNGWVAVYDPIPSGATILGGNPRQSSMTLNDTQTLNELWTTAEERTYDSYRSYYYWFPKGTFEIAYMIRLNQAGEFQLPSTRVEAMYNSDLYGESPNRIFTVKE